jgi:glutamate dehydrogenase/leucine dehydrogenase
LPVPDNSNFVGIRNQWQCLKTRDVTAIDSFIRMLLNWSAKEVDQRLRSIMKNIHQTCLDVAAEYGEPGNYLAGANIAGFVRVVNAMLDQGLG